MQSWGGPSRFNRRQTNGEPTKSAIVGLLAAADGRRRVDPIEDLVALRLGVRTDQPGTLLRDYHTVSDYRGRPMLSSQITAKGVQKLTSPAKFTGVTERFYLQDAVFVAVVSGMPELLSALASAVRSPAFPLALGRRSCVPTQPLVLTRDDADLWPGSVEEVLRSVPWQAGVDAQRRMSQRRDRPSRIELPMTVDDEAALDVVQDRPVTFEPTARSFVSRAVRRGWVTVAPPYAVDPDTAESHDPFALLGW